MNVPWKLVKNVFQIKESKNQYLKYSHGLWFPNCLGVASIYKYITIYEVEVKNYVYMMYLQVYPLDKLLQGNTIDS